MLEDNKEKNKASDEKTLNCPRLILHKTRTNMPPNESFSESPSSEAKRRWCDDPERDHAKPQARAKQTRSGHWPRFAILFSLQLFGIG